MFKRLWHDDAGVLTYEWVMLTTLLVTGVAAGLTQVRDAINSDLTMLAQSIQSLDSSPSAATTASAATQSSASNAAAVGAAPVGLVSPGVASSTWSGNTGTAVHNFHHSLGGIHR